MSATWTMAQAAMIIGKPAQLLQKAVEHAPVKPALAQRGGRRIYVFGMRDLVFFHAWDDIKQDLKSNKQIELYEALKSSPDQAEMGFIEVGHLKYDFGPYFVDVKEKIASIQKLYSLIDDSGAEPMISGTDINAHRIAALQDGMTRSEILQDYPTLNEQQVLAAKLYAEAHPKAGRPYPKMTAKRAMREARADADQFLPTRR